MNRHRKFAAYPSIMGALLLVAGLAGAQEPASRDPLRVQVSRQELQDLLTRYEETAASRASSESDRAHARREAALVRERLERGDFQVGDRILLLVEGDSALRDTFAVSTGRILRLPVVGDIPLTGVLRSELQSTVTEHLRRFYRDPIVRAESMIRISVLGAVGRPGFLVVPSHMLFEDLLMQAGGPAQGAKLRDIRVERGNERIWAGEPLQQAITEGRTLDQLNMRAGDRVVVPATNPSGGIGGWARTLIIVVPTILVALSQLL